MRLHRRAALATLLAGALVLSGCSPPERKFDPEAAKREMQQLQKNRQKEQKLPPNDE